MNRLNFLEEVKQMIYHNKLCYTADTFMNIPKPEYEEEFHKENERLEIITELIEEAKAKDFILNTTMYNIKNNREKIEGKHLACLMDRKNGLSCYLTLQEDSIKNTIQYILKFNIHKKNNFEEEFETISYCREMDKAGLKDKETLQNKMKEELKAVKDIIDRDKSGKRHFAKYYEDEETEEFE